MNAPTLSHRERTIIQMLERWHELATPQQGQPGSRAADRLLLADHDERCHWAEHGRDCTCWVGSVQELGRCLATMRKLGAQRSVAYEHKGKRETIPLGTAYQQLLWWYVDVSYRSVPVVRTLVGKGGRKHTVDTGQRKLEPTRHRDAREEKALAGVRFLARLMRTEPRLPGDVAQLERAA